MNQPIYVAEVNILKLHFSQFVEKTPCIHLIFHLHNRRNAEIITKWAIIKHLKWKHRPKWARFKSTSSSSSKSLNMLSMSMKEFWIILQKKKKWSQWLTRITRIKQKRPSVESNVLQFRSKYKLTTGDFKPSLPVLTCSRFQTSWGGCTVGWCRCQREQNLQPRISGWDNSN